ncbi:AraC family transcriptional regulator [Kitasatospora sp. NA04385]|uniref:helix-turn-helix transcriptional regulator n=1 Tax=Kitasatospora sp. NA04385 TaxID=2742135 RepID=UPI0015916B5B|nr:AraC family transcriptional regulator [Kitasatospora sp. NA04385]QKW20186.1 AraC family transcriptional regulator [Kitasatospora sp. NA04385]
MAEEEVTVVDVVDAHGTDEGCAALVEQMGAQRVQPGPGGLRRVRMRVVPLGGGVVLGAGEVSKGCVFSTAPAGAMVAVEVALRGAMRVTQSDRAAVATAGRTAVTMDGERELRMERGSADVSRGLVLSVPALALHLERLVGAPVARPVVLDPVLGIASGRGAEWAACLEAVWQRLSHGGESLYGHRLMLPLLREQLLTGLLLASGHRWRGQLDRPEAPARPAYLRVALDVINAHPEQAHTPASLAELAGTSVRTLHWAFRTHLDTTPIGYLREVRLQRAHRDLLDADPTRTTVAAVACRWGFTPSRFATHYHHRYGQPPSRTLHAGS